ncbi:MAG: glycosyltransferase, partial [Myxococcales bacterium]|nr:glycosyltransferase [Myxococcales bacterium]
SDLVPSGLQTEVIHVGQNLGPGGGFHLGMQRAMERGADWLWLMDDDIEAESDCAASMLEHTPKGDAMVWPTVRTPYAETEHESVVPGWWGVMLPATAVRRFGLPREDYGWWSEDTEYLQWRLGWFGAVPSVRLPDARVFHNHRDRQGPTPAWKLYYQVRNATHMRLHLRQDGRPAFRPTVRRLWRLWGSQARRALLAVPPEESRRKRLALVVRGVVDGATGRLGLTIPLGDGSVARRSVRRHR